MTDQTHKSTEEKLAKMIQESLMLARMIAEQSIDNPKMTASIMGESVSKAARKIHSQLNELEIKQSGK